MPSVQRYAITLPGGPGLHTPSTVVEVVGARLTLHRAGAIAWDRVLEFLE